jgi:hypothetical protein
MSKTTDNGLKRAENLSPILHGFAPGLCKLPKGCTRLAAANAKAYQLLAHGGWRNVLKGNRISVNNY